MKMKRCVSVILAAVLCFCVLTQGNAAEELADVTFEALDGSGNSSANEGYSKLIDGNTKTKWGTDIKSGESVYIVIKASSAVVLSGYSFTTANDNASYKGRNPKSWVIYACNDYDTNSKSGSWKQICSVEDDGVLKDVNYQKYDFTLDNTELYRYYKLEITAVKSGSFMQLCNQLLR